MKVIVEDKNELLTFKLSKEVTGNYWISNSSRKNLVNIEAVDGKWVLKSNVDVRILKDNNYKENEALTSVNQLKSIELTNYLSFYIVDLATNDRYKIYSMPVFDDTIKQLVFDIKKLPKIVIGNDKKATINCSLPSFSQKQITISYENNLCHIVNENPSLPMYVNDILENNVYLTNGDKIFIGGITFYIISNLLIINNPNNVLFYDSLNLVQRQLPNNPQIEYKSDQETFVEVFNKSEYFQRPPRFKRMIEEKEYKIDAPPASEIKEEMPLIYTMGPMMLMGITSVMSAMTAIMGIISGEKTFKESMTPIITAIVMLISSIVFPFLQKMYTKRMMKRNEKKRRRKYKKYIDRKREEILQEIEIQRQILIENNVPLIDVAKIVLNKQRTLWDRKIEHPDFLNIRLGIGSVKPEIVIEVPEDHFTMDEDDLTDVYEELFDAIKDIENVPVTINLAENPLVGIVGQYNYVKRFMDGFMLQLLSFHSYDNLKIAIISSNERKNTWLKYMNIPHFWNNEKDFRFIGIDHDDINMVSNTLMQAFNERRGLEEDRETKSSGNEKEKYKTYKPYYLIISDEVDYLNSTSIYNELLNCEENFGFSILLIANKIDELPNECKTFINIDPNNSGLFKNELLSTNQIGFKADIPNFNMNQCYISLCNIPVDIAAGKFELPPQYSFLEMYDVGSVKQLNILNRWKNNNPIQSLSAPVGINEQGELFKIDLHERYHGPHGLIAGTTGSGKSEWIITYVLSMCINYHPDEVQFVLIDYKGGGLAGTFENKETGFRIPHLAGTITNLDITEINRSLASINSELKRRQSLFNKARDSLGESSVDIYKYQRWYREGRIDEPISHLFLISDEFAELKAQQPEFMDELISTARIGRSLGVHLILATQKPDGVVNDQIWSNSKFKVCLKVQDKSDSKAMIQVPDAAFLKEAGRFYLQVGYNEFFAKGQSAYAGGPYYESDRHKKTVDTDLLFVNTIGETYKIINSEKVVVAEESKGEELGNILKELVDVSKEVELHVKKLWIDAIPEKIYLEELKKKYSYKKESFNINPVIGEYDAPQYQKQGLLTLPLSEKGNTAVYGVAGSGKDMFVSTLVYSLMTTYFVDECNIYVVDCGAETTNAFRKSPAVGDIMFINDVNKITNLFKFIMKELNQRKKDFADYNGDYNLYCKKSGQTVPNIIVIINNFDNFKESYGAFEDAITVISRDCTKYGIFFVITAVVSNSLRYKMIQNFNQQLVLHQNDAMEYTMILQNPKKIVPANLKGRGIVKNGEVYEFQTATIADGDNVVETIMNVSKLLREKSDKVAPEIKVIPKKVDEEYITEYITTLEKVPIGVERDSLEISYVDFINDKGFAISAKNEKFIKGFTDILYKVIDKSIKESKVLLFPKKQIEINFEKIKIINDNFEEYFKQISDYSSKNPDSKCVLLIENLDIIKEQNITTIIKTFIDKNIKIILIGESTLIKELYLDEDFKKLVDTSKGIWISGGILDQNIIEVEYGKEYQEELPDFAGYNINDNKGIKVKLINTIYAELEEDV